MKNYKDFEKMSIGVTDIASVVLRDPEKILDMHLDSDGGINAYLCNEEVQVGDHYQHVDTFHHWLWVYDDSHRVIQVYGDRIEVYKAKNTLVIYYQNEEDLKEVH